MEPPLEDRLERDELVVFPACPFPLPGGGDRDFLMERRVAWGRKNVNYDPLTGRAHGHRDATPATDDRLRDLLGTFARHAADWLAAALPGYAAAWQPNHATLRPEEEATRRLRLTARNDLLHIDNFPSRPAFGRRLLRLYVNLDPVGPRVWATSENFPRLLERYRGIHRLPLLTRQEWVRPRPGVWNRWGGACSYDALMHRMHNFLKQDDVFQDRARKQLWELPPGSMWLLFADSLSHAVLRGRCALERSFFVPVNATDSPLWAPLSLLAAATPSHRAA